MTPPAQSESGDPEPLTGALLIECDSTARIRWMSAPARASFGEAGHLVDVMRRLAPSAPSAILTLASAARFSPVFQRGDSIWISAELADRAENTAHQEPLTLLSMQSGLLRNYFRLQVAERQLATRTKGLRRTSGTGALLQVERERQRLARELHAGVGQALTAIRLQLEIIAAHQREASAPVAEALSRISRLVADALEHTRSVSRWLHPPEWQRITLPAAIRQLWENSGVPQRFEASLRVDPLPAEPALGTKILFYRAAQEALSNLVRHSRASRVTMSLEARDGRLVLTVEDDGVGFDATGLFSAPAGSVTGIGLRAIREQAEALNGTFTVESGLDGTRLERSAPLWEEDT